MMKVYSILCVCLLLVSIMTNEVEAGPVAYGYCQSGCAAVVVACYAAGGFTFGTITVGFGMSLIIVQILWW